MGSARQSTRSEGRGRQEWRERGPGRRRQGGAPGLDGRSIYLAEVSGGDTWLGVEEIDTGGRSIHVGDSILSTEGDVYAVIGIACSEIHVGQKIMSLAGPEGPQGIPGPAGSAAHSRNSRIIAEWRSNVRYILTRNNAGRSPSRRSGPGPGTGSRWGPSSRGSTPLGYPSARRPHHSSSTDHLVRPSGLRDVHDKQGLLPSHGHDDHGA